MKLRIATLTILCLALAAIPALAQYDNGPINGTTDAWTINFGYVVSDTFVAGGSPSVASRSAPGNSRATPADGRLVDHHCGEWWNHVLAPVRRS